MALREDDVFVNCPFDAGYKPMLDAIVFTIVRSGYRARCALEADNAANNRLDKICGIIRECRFGIHDISRTEPEPGSGLPRFNMPLELGLFLGACRFGGKAQQGKSCIVFDREPYRFQKFISDIAGHDIHAHGGDVATMIRDLAGWFRKLPGGLAVPGGFAMSEEYARFEKTLPDICAARQLHVAELEFSDLNEIVTEYVATL